MARAVGSEIERLRLYPNPRSEALRVAAAAICGVGSEQVIVGNGSDDTLNLLVRAFGGPGRRVTPNLLFLLTQDREEPGQRAVGDVVLLDPASEWTVDRDGRRRPSRSASIDSR